MAKKVKKETKMALAILVVTVVICAVMLLMENPDFNWWILGGAALFGAGFVIWAIYQIIRKTLDYFFYIDSPDKKALIAKMTPEGRKTLQKIKVVYIAGGFITFVVVVFTLWILQLPPIIARSISWSLLGFVPGGATLSVEIYKKIKKTHV